MIIRKYLLTAAALLTLIAGGFSDAGARKIKTKLPTKYSSRAAAGDSGKSGSGTIISRDDTTSHFNDADRKIRFYGFDKTASSKTESFFVVNGTDSILTSMTIEITYYDMKRRQLHRRDVNIACDIPANETRRIDTTTWDTQQSFYYIKSVKPRRQATPFDVVIKLKSVTVLTAEDSVVDQGVKAIPARSGD